MKLEGKTVAVLVEDTYQELEFWYPYLRMQEAGAKTIAVGPPGRDTFTSKLGYPVQAGAASDQISADDVDAVIVPGGYAPDRMRRDPGMLKLVKEAFDAGKIVATICHAGWVLVSADVLSGKKATCVPAIKDDVMNAGATYIDAEVVIDGNLITSRVPDDLPAFCRAIIEALSH